MPDLYLPPLCTIHPWSPEAMGPQLNAWNVGMSSAASSTWLNTNNADLVPFRLNSPTSIQQAWAYNGATVSGHWDIGVYDESLTLLAHTGSVAQAGTSVIQAANFSVKLGVGRFYFAIAVDNVLATFFRIVGSGQSLTFAGQLRSTNAFPLPPKATVTGGQAYLPIFGLSTRSLI